MSSDRAVRIGLHPYNLSLMAIDGDGYTAPGPRRDCRVELLEVAEPARQVAQPRAGQVRAVHEAGRRSPIGADGRTVVAG